jgi:hypothetical protein
VNVEHRVDQVNCQCVLLKGMMLRNQDRPSLSSAVCIEGDLFDLQRFASMEDQSVRLRKLGIDSRFKTITDMNRLMREWLDIFQIHFSHFPESRYP